MFRKILPALLLCFSVFGSLTRAQDCKPPGIAANAKSTNLFTPEQEMIFGELTLQNMAGEVRLIHDEKLLAYVRHIGDRLAKHLPPTGLRFQYHLVDIPEANAFNTPGGHVFLSRKLIAFVNNEDELAGVMAHEFGHAVVRHAAVDVSEALRKILGVSALGDRRDITEKYNLLIERARTKRVPRRHGHEDAQQLEADRIGVFAMVAAGYDPAAFFSFFDRLTESEGKTGNWFSDLFGRLPPAQKRLREIARATEQLAPACRDGRAARATEDFLKWQADVVSFRETGRKEELPGLLRKRELAPKLRSDIAHFAFSPDGRLLLAQDDFAVTILEREPLRVLFQIPVEEAREAAFTPDGQFVVFTTENLRYEKWSVAERKPVAVRELVLRRDCWEHKLSPDGNYLACVDTSTAINVLDAATGKKIWERKEFYPLSFWEYISWLRSAEGEDGGQTNLFRIEFSPDSRIVMFSRSDRLRFRFVVGGMTRDSSENVALALDLTTLKPAEPGGDLKKISSHAYLFLDAERVLGRPSQKLEDGGIFSFPGGKRLRKFAFAPQEIKRTANPDYVVIAPVTGMKMGVFDLKKGVIASGVNKEAVTLWNNLMALESAGGKILLWEVSPNEAEKRFDTKEVGAADLPVSSIRGLSAAAVSDGFDWLLLSSKTRGGLWDLRTGERKLYVRGFKGGIVADDGAAVGDFPTLGEVTHSLVLLNANNGAAAPILALPEKGAQQHGRFVLLRHKLNEGEKKEEKQGLPGPPAGDRDGEDSGLRRNVRFELRDFIQDKVIWSRDFPKEVPEFSFDEFSGRLIFYWRLGSDTGKAKLKEVAELQARAAALGNKSDDYLVEVVDAFAQKTVGTVLVETGQGSFAVGEGLAEGDWLVLRDPRGRVLAYSIKSGDLRHRFFGRHAALNPQKNQIAVENFPGEVSLYDLDTGDRRATYVINGSAAFVRFNLDGTRLIVLSDAQSAYTFDLTKLAPRAAANSGAGVPR